MNLISKLSRKNSKRSQQIQLDAENLRWQQYVNEVISNASKRGMI
jgi:hypothetical protein